MSERKNIERLFQEKFKDFEVEPSEKVWKNIESKLKEKKENRKVIPFWLKLSGIAAALLIGFFTTDTLLNPKKDSIPNIVVEENKPLQNSNLNSKTNKGTITSSEVSKTETKEDINSHSSNKIASQSEIYKSKANENTEWNSVNNAVTQSEISKAEIEKNNNPNSSNRIINGNSSVAKRKSKYDLNTGLKENNKTVVSNDSRNNSRKNTKKSTFKNKKESNSIFESSILRPQNQLETVTAKNANSGLANQISTENKTQENTLDNKSSENKNQIDIVTHNEIVEKTDSTSIAIIVPNELEELLKEKENKIVDKETKLNKWEIAPTVAPIYFSSTSNGSPLDAKFENNSKDYKTNLGYGLGVKYALNTKFSLRTGVNAVALEYNTNDVVFYQNKSAVAIKHIDNNIQGSLIQIENRNPNALPELSANNTIVKKFDGDLNQKTGYIEIPLELSYKIVDKKFGVEIIGGVSTLFLNENTVSLVSSGMEMNIGEANNLNATHFSTNIGLGFKYNLMKSFQVNFEPMFKYQINTFSNDSGSFKPYFFGLYSGISYRF